MKIDFKKELKEIYSAPVDHPVVITVPSLRYLAVDGHGNPNANTEYLGAMSALYGLSYAIKFNLKKDGLDYVVAPLEGLWWADDMASFGLGDKESWKWTMMIMQPTQVSDDLLVAVRDELQRRKGSGRLADVRLCAHEDGLAAQIMHLGPYSEESPTIARLHQFIAEHGYERRGKHREIYLSDPNRSKPENLKTIIRQPIAPRLEKTE